MDSSRGLGVRCGLLLGLHLFRLRGHFLESVDAPFRIYEFLPSCEKWMATRADFHA